MARYALRHTPKGNKKQRRGIVVILAAIVLVVMLAMAAFAVDLGYVALVRTQLQTAADAAALAAVATSTTIDDAKATALSYANQHRASGRQIAIQAGDVQCGTWNADTGVFTVVTSGLSNAVKVTTKTDETRGGRTALFFGNIFGLSSITQQASAIATTNPRDICFVIDLSASMHYDAQPSYDTGAGSVRGTLIQKVYDDLEFNATYSYTDTYYPSASFNTCFLGQPLLTVDGATIRWNNGSLQAKTSTSWQTATADRLITLLKSKLSNASWNGTVYYTGTVGMTDSAKTIAAYSYVIDYTLKQYAMPSAVPDATTAYYSYWKDYVGNNPRKLGYKSYVEYMVKLDRDGKNGAGFYTPFSMNSTLYPDQAVVPCKTHPEATPGGTFDFPPSEQPTHGGRRAIIAALQLIKTRNETITDANRRDWVSVISFDRGRDPAGGTTLWYSLGSDYTTAMQKCTQLQACYESGACTATATGLIAGYDHIKRVADGGLGRASTNKIIVLLTDGKPNLTPTNYSMTITPYTGNSSKDAALTQAATLQGENWYVYTVGIGLATDPDFMDRMATLGGTSVSHVATDAENYEADLTTIFDNIITHPKLRLVK